MPPPYWRRLGSDLVTANGLVLVFLHVVPDAVQIPIDRRLRPVRVFFVRRAPADSNQARNDQDFNE